MRPGSPDSGFSHDEFSFVQRKSLESKRFTLVMRFSVSLHVIFTEAPRNSSPRPAGSSADVTVTLHPGPGLLGRQGPGGPARPGQTSSLQAAHRVWGQGRGPEAWDGAQARLQGPAENTGPRGGRAPSTELLW